MTSPPIHVDLLAIKPLDIVWFTAVSTYLIVCCRSDVIFFVTIALIIAKLMVNSLVISYPKQIVQLGTVCDEEKYADSKDDVTCESHNEVE